MFAHKAFTLNLGRPWNTKAAQKDYIFLNLWIINIQSMDFKHSSKYHRKSNFKEAQNDNLLAKNMITWKQHRFIQQV